MGSCKLIPVTTFSLGQSDLDSAEALACLPLPLWVSGPFLYAQLCRFPPLLRWMQIARKTNRL